MILKEMKFTTNDEDVTNPSSLTVEITIEEAIWMAILSGSQRGISPHFGIFDCLTGDVFNRYWDDGVDDARLDYPVETPPVRYE